MPLIEVVSTDSRRCPPGWGRPGLNEGRVGTTRTPTTGSIDASLNQSHREPTTTRSSKEADSCEPTTSIRKLLDAMHSVAAQSSLAASPHSVCSKLADSLGNVETALLSMGNDEDEGGEANLEKKKKNNEQRDPSRYDIASSLIRLRFGPTSISTSTTLSTTEEDKAVLLLVQSRVDRCLDLCGPACSFLAAIDFLRSGTVSTINSREAGQTKALDDAPAAERADKLESVGSDPMVIATAIRTARRLLLTIPNEEELAGDPHQRIALPLNDLCRDYYELSLLPSERRLGKVDTVGMLNAMDDLASRSILLPVGIGSACHRAMLRLPTWAARDRYCKRLVEVAVEAAVFDSETATGERRTETLAVLYFGRLLDKMARHGASDSVVLGLHRFWTRRFRGTDDYKDPSVTSFSAAIESAISSIESSRDCANLLRSMIRFAASKLNNEQLQCMRKRSGDEGQEKIWSAAPMIFLQRTCLPVLRSSERSRDALFRLVVLSPPPSSSTTENDSRWLVIPCIVASLLFALTGNQDKQKGVETDVLFQYLREASETWLESAFVRLVDESQQLYVTEFIMSSIPFLDKSKMDADLHQSIVMSLVQGVTTRLESSNMLIRRQGMRVAEMLAPLLGQKLRFAELDDVRDVDNVQDGKDKSNEKKSVKNQSGTPTNNADSSIQRKPKEEHDDEDSIWSEVDLVPYDLEDDEDDLSAVKRPRYLRDCLALFRIPADDKNAFDSIEAALKYIAPLVTTKPPDLPDLAAPLAKELLHAEDKFNMNDFASLRWDGLCALIVHEPIAVSRLFTESLFDSISLGVRLDILGLFEHAADDLCGAAALREDRNSRKELLLSGPTRHSKTIGKRSLVLQGESTENSSSCRSVGLVCNEHSVEALKLKTRRWGRGRHPSQQKTATNRFGQIAPLFFYPLISGWIRTKDDKSIWGGANGARFFASFLVALAKIVESSGHYPGTIVLASDLFDLAWPFRGADSSEIRVAVLVVIATCCPFLPVDFFADRYQDEGLGVFLRAAALRDSDATCRQIAAVITKSITSNVMALGN